MLTHIKPTGVTKKHRASDIYILDLCSLAIRSLFVQLPNSFFLVRLFDLLFLIFAPKILTT